MKTVSIAPLHRFDLPTLMNTKAIKRCLKCSDCWCSKGLSNLFSYVDWPSGLPGVFPVASWPVSQAASQARLIHFFLNVSDWSDSYRGRGLGSQETCSLKKYPIKCHKMIYKLQFLHVEWGVCDCLSLLERLNKTILAEVLAYSCLHFNVFFYYNRFFSKGL